MPVELTDGDILLYTLRYTYQAQTMLNTWLYRVSQFTPELIDYEDACDAWLIELESPGDFIEQLTPLLFSTCRMVDHRLQRIHPSRNRAYVRTLGINGTNGATVGATVNQAAVVTKYGNVAGRFAVGSWHQGGLPQNVLDDTGKVTTAYQTDIGTAVGKLLVLGGNTAFPATSATPILWNKAVPTRVTPITQVVPQATARVMRRRTVGLGI